MRRIALLLLMMLLGCSAAYGEAEELKWLSPTIGGNDAVMIVDNGDEWDVKLNLRTEQRKGSEIRGRIYTGTRVEIYQDNGEWCTVGLNFEGGSVLTGEVMKKYLAPLTDEFDALCPLAAAQQTVEITGGTGVTVACLQPGDTAYVMAACGERYFVLVPGYGQGYVPKDAFSPLAEPDEDQRIIYKRLTVPSGGVTFVHDRTGEEVRLVGGVRLEDCWRMPGNAEWNVTYGAGIQRTPRVKGRIPAEKLTNDTEVPFEGEVYDWNEGFIAVVGELNGKKILRRTDKNGDIFWALGMPPQEGALIEGDLYEIRAEATRILSRETVNRMREYIVERRAIDERGTGSVVTAELIEECRMYAALVMDPATGELLKIRVWFEDENGSYVTGGDIEPRSGAIIRWGCNG